MPNQKFLKQYYKDKNIDYYKKLFNLSKNVSRVELPETEFNLKNGTKFPIAEMASNPLILNFYSFLIRSCNITNILEIGSFIGYSSIFLAKHSSKETRITSIEKYKIFYEIAKKNILKNKLNKKITLINNDANNELTKMTLKKKIKFDLVFLDGDKGNYLKFFKLIEKLIKKNTIIIVDNVYFQGDVINSKPKTEKGKGVNKFLNYIKKKNNFYISLLPAYDGILFLRRK